MICDSPLPFWVIFLLGGHIKEGFKLLIHLTPTLKNSIMNVCFAKLMRKTQIIFQFGHAVCH